MNKYDSLLKKTKIFLFSPFFCTGVLVLVAIVFTKYYFLLTNEYYPPAYADNIANFKADKVFQKRFLVPVTANFFSQNTPLSFDKSLKFINIIFTLGLLFYFKKILKRFTNCYSESYWYLILLVPVSWNYIFINSIYHAYDIPTLFFYCACVYLFITRKYIPFYILFVLATLNRESTCFITISITLLLFKLNIKNNLNENFRINLFLIRHLVVQTSLWLLLFFMIRWFVQNSPGQAYESTYSMKSFITNMWNGSPSWPFINTEKFLGNPKCFLTLFGCIWVFIPLLWKFITNDCKKLLFLIPIYMIPALSYANLMETRVYHELNVVLSLTVAVGFIEFQKSLKLRSNIKVC